ncbi:hypothetical protein FJZ53_04080 [Candidatus Woesearchaeota archaeon]|nr:hypothetical protein [Candidatus Woesearchaeota archaeon]
MKKGAFDLGRKSVYYIVVVIIIAILFGYMSNVFRDYQIAKLSTVDETADLIVVNKVIKCVSQKDPDTNNILLYRIDDSKLDGEFLKSCLGTESPYTDRSVKLIIGGKETVTQEAAMKYSEYTRTVKYNGKDETLYISVEKYREIK